MRRWAMWAAVAALVLGGGGEVFSQGIENEIVARLKSSQATERAAAARELGERGSMAHNEALAALLRDKEAGVREAALGAMWRIWMRSGDPEVDQLMILGTRLMEEKHLKEAVAQFDEVVRRKPRFAEGWNKRATAYFLMGRYRESIADCEKVLALNRFHFGALFGLGLNYVGLEDFESAIAAFQRTLEVTPYSAEARRSIRLLERALERKRKKI